MSTDTDFLTELAGPNTSVDSTDAPASGEVTETNDADKPKYPNIVESREEGADVSDLLTPTQFASKLTVRNVLKENSKPTDEQNLEDPSLTVPVTNVYTAMKAARHPIPVVMVGDTAYLQSFELSAHAWDERPTRGEGGTTAGSKLDDDRLKALSWKTYEEVEKLNKRLDSIKERLDKATKRKDMRSRQLSERGISWDQVEEYAAENLDGQDISDDENE